MPAGCSNRPPTSAPRLRRRRPAYARSRCRTHSRTTVRAPRRTRRSCTTCTSPRRISTTPARWSTNSRVSASRPARSTRRKSGTGWDARPDCGSRTSPRRGAICGSSVPSTRWRAWQSAAATRRTHTHVDAAKAILDKGTNPDQAIFFPYLTGYVALYAGDYKRAVSELQHANQRDPFILCLMGQAYEKLGDTAGAKDAYTRALAVSNAHNPPAAYGRPFAKSRLAALR